MEEAESVGLGATVETKFVLLLSLGLFTEMELMVNSGETFPDDPMNANR